MTHRRGMTPWDICQCPYCTTHRDAATSSGIDAPDVAGQTPGTAVSREAIGGAG